MILLLLQCLFVTVSAFDCYFSLTFTNKTKCTTAIANTATTDADIDCNAYDSIIVAVVVVVCVAIINSIVITIISCCVCV